jgi:WD40 repeat protein
LAWSPNGQYFATGYADGTLRITEAASLTSWTLTGHIGGVYDLSWNNDNRRLATGGASPDNSVRVWDVISRQQLRLFSDLGTDVAAVSWRQGTEQVLAIPLEKGAKVLDVASGQILLTRSIGAVTGIAWNATYDKIALINTSVIVIRDAATLDLLLELSQATLDKYDNFFNLTWNSSLNRIAATTIRGQVMVWDSVTGALRFAQGANNYVGPDELMDFALEARLSADGTLVSTISRDGTYKVWDMTRELILIDEILPAPIWAANWSLDGTKLAVGRLLNDPVEVRNVPTLYTLKVQYYPETTTATPFSELIAPTFSIVNSAGSAVPLSQIKLRYYFTRDTTQEVQFACSWTALPGNCESVTGQVVVLPTPVDGADAYLEVGFTTGLLAANSPTLEIIVRLNKADWTDFDQRNDYSFDPTSTAPVWKDWTKVTLYRNDVLLWGTPPQ